MPCQPKLGRQERVWAKCLEFDIRASANVGTFLDSQSAKPSVCALGRFPLSEMCFLFQQRERGRCRGSRMS